MAFDSTGKWVAEPDQSVETKLNAITSSSNPYIQQARQTGTTTAAKRGLLNSSIAAGASEGSAIAAALPIAQQDAAQTATNNLAGQNAGYADEQIDRTNAGQIKLAGVNNDASLNLANVNNTATSSLADKNNSASLTQLQTQISGTSALADKTNEAQLGLANVNNAASAANLNTSIAGTAALQSQSDAATLARQQAAAQAQSALQAQVDAGTATRQQEAELAQMKLQAQTDSAAMDRQTAATAASSQAAALQAALNANSTYATEFDALQANTAIPAATRDSYIKQLQATRDSGIDMIQQIYGVSLNWNKSTSSGTSSLGYTPVAAVKPAGVSDKDWAKQQAATSSATRAAYA